VTSLAEAAKGGTGQLSLFLIDGNQFHAGAGEEPVEVAQAFGAIS
jgi:hypothetical protein